MENPAWVRMIVVGLVLAVLAVGYFLLSGSFVKSKPRIDSVKTTVVETPTGAVNGVAMNISPTPTPATQSAYNRIVNRTQNQNQYQYGTQGGTQTLPRTGFPVGLISLLSASVAIAGWGLRRFPH